MPALELSAAERRDLERACAHERRVRHWRRYRALLLVADGHGVPEVARLLDCCANSVWNWLATWHRGGLVALEEPPHGGRRPVLAGASAATLEQVLTRDPQQSGLHATGWTVPLVQAELARQQIAVSQHTIRRTLHRLGWRWKRPKYVLGRPDPADAEKRGR